MRQWLFESNSLKLEHWNALVQQAPDGDRILLIDADMLVVRPLDPVWDRPFDVAYTVRPSGAKFPLNGGVVAVRVGAASRAFMQAWAAENRRMLNDQAHHNRWRQRFGGINQAALGALLAAGVRGQFATLPCLEWNCEDSCWGKFDPAVTRLVHIKSELRLACRSRADQRGRWQPIVDRWRAADRESLRASA
jgi:alpha-N-acetylglucosamine transferase